MKDEESEATILVIEDEEDIRFALESGLKREGYRVFSTGRGEKGLEIFSGHCVDLVLIDIILPDLSGMDLCRLIRKSSEVPIIMVTARDAEADIVAGLEMGADDYVTKPFSLSELTARIRANLRRQTTEQIDSSSAVMHLGQLTLYSRLYEAVDHQGEDLDLTPRLFRLLWYLGRHKGEVCSRDEILSSVWGYDYFGETRTVDVHIHWLREKLRGRCPDISLKTIRGVGYKLVIENER